MARRLLPTRPPDRRITAEVVSVISSGSCNLLKMHGQWEWPKILNFGQVRIFGKECGILPAIFALIDVTGPARPRFQIRTCRSIMSVVVREMRPEDSRAFLEVHHAAARGIAGKDYPSAVIKAWAPMPITDKHVEGVLSNPDNEYRLIAEIDGLIVGIGAVILEKAELRACYVIPSASRNGVGSLLVQKIEQVAREYGLKTLDLDATVTAELFYSVHGYSVCDRGELILRGQRMACVKMRKVLASQIS